MSSKSWPYHVKNSQMQRYKLPACEKGLLLFWLLFEGKAIRITPPLTISEDEIKKGCAIIIEVLNEIDLENQDIT